VICPPASVDRSILFVFRPMYLEMYMDDALNSEQAFYAYLEKCTAVLERNINWSLDYIISKILFMVATSCMRTNTLKGILNCTLW
jgi:hypothetical protein